MRTLCALFSIIFLLTVSATAQAQIYQSTKTEVSFFSKTPLEDISAVSREATALIDFGKNKLAVRIPIKSFHFPNGLMEEHFNENYMETTKFPNAQFTGDLSTPVDPTKPGTYKVKATGQLTVHGVTKPRTLEGTLVIADGKAALTSAFNIQLVEHNIEIPTAVLMKIAESIDVKARYDLSPKAGK